MAMHVKYNLKTLFFLINGLYERTRFQWTKITVFESHHNFFLKKLSHPYSLKTSFKKDFYIFNIS